MSCHGDMKERKAILSLLAALLLGAPGCQRAVRLPAATEQWIDSLIEGEIEKGSFPGAVVLIGLGRRTLYYKAFGRQIITGPNESISEQTIFDIASLTKPLATATAIMILRDRGLIRLGDRVSKYLPGFGCAGKEDVRIEDLLTHTSGLAAYTNAEELKRQFGSPCPQKLLERICSAEALSEPRKEFRYSCLGYIVLGRVVELISGRRLDEFTAENIFEPLRMEQTCYNPPASWRTKIAATEVVDGQALRGTVHDPLARLMAGRSGNAGVFSTAADLARYCRMLLNGGKAGRRRILSGESVDLLTRRRRLGRACGFDVDSSYSWIKGSLAPEGTFCHSGYTGTSVVCDPGSKVFIIILTNRAHPNDQGSTRAVRTQLADTVFGWLGQGRQETKMPGDSQGPASAKETL